MGLETRRCVVCLLDSIREVAGAVRKSSLQLLAWNSWHLSFDNSRLMKHPLSTSMPAPFSLGLIFGNERDSQNCKRGYFCQSSQFTQMRKLRQLNNPSSWCSLCKWVGRLSRAFGFTENESKHTGIFPTAEVILLGMEGIHLGLHLLCKVIGVCILKKGEFLPDALSKLPWYIM